MMALGFKIKGKSIGNYAYTSKLLTDMDASSQIMDWVASTMKRGKRGMYLLSCIHQTSALQARLMIVY
jgi:hypothetical protein